MDVLTRPNPTQLLLMRRIFLLVVAFVAIAAARADDEEYQNVYCHDHGAQQEWQDLVKRFPQDTQTQMLHALWLGLCLKVDRKEINTQQAIELFEGARARILEGRRREQGEKTRQSRDM